MKEIIAIIFGVFASVISIFSFLFAVYKFYNPSYKDIRIYLKVPTPAEWTDYSDYKAKERNISNRKIIEIVHFENFLNAKIKEYYNCCTKLKESNEEYKKKSFIGAIIAVVILSIVFTVIANNFLFSNTKYGRQKTIGEYTVCYITDNGQYYHAAECQYLYNSSHKTTVYKVSEKYDPCPKCDVGELSFSQKNNFYYCGWISVSVMGFVVWLIYRWIVLDNEEAERRHINNIQEEAITYTKHAYYLLVNIIDYNCRIVFELMNEDEKSYIDSVKKKISKFQNEHSKNNMINFHGLYMIDSKSYTQNIDKNILEKIEERFDVYKKSIYEYSRGNIVESEIIQDRIFSTWDDYL